MSQTTSTTLIAALKSGKAEAWWQYVEIYTPLIASWLRRYDMYHLQEDLIQTTNTTVWRRIKDFHKPQRGGAFRKWLRTIALNQLRSYHRVQKRRPLQVSIEADSIVDPHSELPGASESVRLLVRQVVMTMKHPRMTEPQRQAVLEHLLQGTSVLRAARMFDLHEGTLRAKVNACLARLRRVLLDELQP